MRKAYSYIRMSTETQLKGDSLRRQLDGAETYAKNNALELVNSIDGTSLKDLGVSAFNGKNKQKGALSIFLAALDQGKIESNSILLIESLDRLSRDRLSEAIPQFIEILNNGIEIITLIDNQRYTKEIINTNPGSLFISLGAMLRANDESETKSKRGRAAWSNKRNNSDKKIITTLCPAWLKFSKINNVFEFIYDRKKVVELIFDMCINSGGLYSIARHLNENKIPVFGNGKMWHRSYINKIINNRSVIGEFQPHEMINGKRQKCGNPINSYFPKAIEEQQFLLAHVAIARRTNICKGRKGTFFSNLFSGITYCGNCHFKMTVRNHGNEQKGGRFLICSNKNMKAGCNSSEWNIDDFYGKIFPHLNELNFDEILQEKPEKNLISLADYIDVLLLKSKEKEIEQNRSLDLIISENFNETIKSKLSSKINNLQVEIDELELEIKNTKNKISEEETARDVRNPEKLKVFIGKIEQHKEDYIFRSSVNQLLIRIISKVELIESTDDFMPWELDEESYEVVNYRKTFLIRSKRHLDEILKSSDFEKFYKNQQRNIKITYKNGAVRHILWGQNISFGGYHKNQLSSNQV
jgi:DNA invertase Pin-like site-specific DNA recombinase